VAVPLVEVVRGADRNEVADAAILLGEPIEQSRYSFLTQLVGWIYHFSNGATFGVMYLALIRDASNRRWSWAVLFALALELGMLLTPYPTVFDIPLTARFVVITIVAHAIFGAGLGTSVRRISRRLTVRSARPVPAG